MRCSNDAAGFRAAHRRRLHRHRHDGTRRRRSTLFGINLSLFLSFFFESNLLRATFRAFRSLYHHHVVQFLSFVFVFFLCNPFSFSFLKTRGTHPKVFFFGFFLSLSRFFFGFFFNTTTSSVVVMPIFFLYDERLFGITTYNLKRHYFLKCHNTHTHTHTHTHTYIYINMALTSMLSATKVYFRISSRFAVLFCFVFS